MRKTTQFALTIAVFVTACHMAHAQPPSGPRPPEFNSPEVSADKKVTFRVHAPKAEKVRLTSSDMPGTGMGGLELKKGDNGVWEGTAGPVAPGAIAITSTSTASP